MSKFTPGEWTIHHAYIDEKPNVVIDPFGKTWVSLDTRIASGDKIIGTISMTSCSDSLGWPMVSNMIEHKANVNLVLSAHSMYEALKWAIGFTKKQLESGCSFSSEDTPHWNAALKAIDKAEGNDV